MPTTALEEVVLGLGTHFHPAVGRAFLEEMGYDDARRNVVIAKRIADADATEVARVVRAFRVDYGDDIREAA